MQPVHLATIAPHQERELCMFCIKAPSQPDKVLPMLCYDRLAGVVWAAHQGVLPPNLVYHTLNDLLCEDGSYIGAVEIVGADDEGFDEETRDALRTNQLAIVSRILRHKNFRTKFSIINPVEGIVFAYIHNYPLLCSNSILKLFTPVEMVFTDRNTKEQFENDLLLHRKS